MKKVYVCKITGLDVQKHWGAAPHKMFRSSIYARCNKKGIVNWQTTRIYYSSEVKEARFVKVESLQ